MEQEIWKNIEWYENYQVSNLWRVKSLERKLKWRRDSQRIQKEKILCNLKSWWYHRVSLSKNNVIKYNLVSRLVAQAFLWLDISNKKIYVCHKDDNWENNNVNNLFLGTPKDNMQDMINKWRNIITRWEKSWMAILNDKNIIEIRKLYSTWIKQFKIAQLFKVSRPTVNAVIHNKLWKHI